LGVLVDNASGQKAVLLLARALRTVGLRIDDYVSEIKIVVARVPVIVRERSRADAVIGLEDVEPHNHSGQRRGDMIGGAAKETGMEFGPGF